jgi:DNA-binding transcriptional MerR regulator
MKLSELATQSGVSKTTLKHWIRVGIMPTGYLRNRTTAVYEQRHVDRALLIKLMRDDFRAPVEQIHRLTSIIDANDTPTLEVMRACQAFALGVTEDSATGPEFEPFRERVYEMMRRRGWRGYPGAAEQALAQAMRFASAVGLDYDVDELMEYADALEPLATRNIVALGPTGSPDQVALRTLMAVNARARQLVAISGLAHAAASIRAAIDRGDAPPDLALPPAAPRG